MPETFAFRDLRDLLAKANEEKSGDQLAGIAAGSERERVAAKRKLADLTLGEIFRQPLIDPAQDEVSRLLLETCDAARFQEIQSLTVGEFREFILDDSTSETQLKELQWAIVPEIAAAVAKLMSNKDLILAAAKIRNVTRCRNTLGERGVLGIRIAAQSSRRRPGRDPAGGVRGIAFRLRGRRDRRESGVRFGGDGPRNSQRARAADRCLRRADPGVLSRSYHHAARSHEAGRAGRSALSVDCRDRSRQSQFRRHSILAARRARTGARTSCPAAMFPGRATDAMYFETGQGSALSAGAHHGVDQLTLEARAYGVARVFRSVSGEQRGGLHRSGVSVR